MDGAAFRTLLAERPLIADGGMGTALIDAGAPMGACLELLSVEDAGRVLGVHRGFVDAGAELVLTNTFGANRFRLGPHNLDARVEELNRAGVRVARESGARFVAGSMGPLGVRLAPYGRVRPEDAFAAYRRAGGGPGSRGRGSVRDRDPERSARDGAGGRGGARCRPGRGGRGYRHVHEGRSDAPRLLTRHVAAALVALGVDALGANCGEGPAQVLRVIRAMRSAAGDVPLVARPNAGGPTQVGGRFVYPATPEYVAEHAAAFADEGAAVIGGCCGTGPAHTAAIASALEGRTTPALIVVESAPDETGTPPRPAALPTDLEASLAAGRFVIAVEMEPPRSFDTGTLVAAAETLAAAGADVIDVADSPMAKMRMSAWAACRLIQERVGVETVLHFPTRGRNLLRLQGDLLGAAALGIRNLFVCVGDPVTIGDFPQGSNNVDVTATGLLALVNHGFNLGRDRGGSSIGEPTSFFAGAAVAPNAQDLERECRLLKKKIDAGARFLLSQPVYDADPIARLRETYERVAGEPLVTTRARRRASARDRPSRRVPTQRGPWDRDP